MKRSELDEEPETTRTIAERWRDFKRAGPSDEVREYVRQFSAAFKLAPSLYQFGKKREKL